MCVFVFQLHAIFRFYVCDIAHLQAVCQVNCFSCCRRFLREELSRELSTDFVLLHDPAEPRCKFMLFTVLFVCLSICFVRERSKAANITGCALRSSGSDRLHVPIIRRSTADLCTGLKFRARPGPAR